MDARNRRNQLGDHHGFTHASAAKNTRFATLSKGGDQVDDFDAGFKNLDAG